MESGTGYGKVIICGEHFVVHGIPAIASAIESETTATVEKIPGNSIELHDNRKASGDYKEKKRQQQNDSIANILSACGLTGNGIRITLGGNLIAASGIGASAASCVAIARALNREFKLGYNEEKINDIAYQGELGYHGTPSGIDNTVSTFGSLMWFQKTEKATYSKIAISNPIEIVMGDSGKTTDTKKAVEDLGQRRAKEPAKYEKLFKDAERIAYKARAALEGDRLAELGTYMNENHHVLQEIGVSNNKLDFMVALARKNGALGAKLTGSGQGGFMVALTPGKERQKKVAEALEKEGFIVIRTKIGSELKRA